MPDPIKMPIIIARGIAPDSWLNQPKYSWFREGYAYAATCTNAIPSLAKVTPEDAFWIVYTVNSGARRAGHPVDLGKHEGEEEMARLRRENAALRELARDAGTVTETRVDPTH